MRLIISIQWLVIIESFSFARLGLIRIRSIEVSLVYNYLVNEMNKFKLLSSSLEQVQRKTDGSHDMKQHRKEQVQLLNILDKCTQILRDDRIWIRNRIKQLDPQILAIFKKCRRNPTSNRISEAELHQLQVTLRKHVNRIKERHKQQQLTRFKENLCSTNCLCQKNRHSIASKNQHHTDRYWGQEMANRPHFEDTHQHSQQMTQQHRQDKQPDSESTFNNLFKNKKKNLFEALKLNEPIEEESEKETQKLSSYRSKSEEPFSKIGGYQFQDRRGEKQSPHKKSRQQSPEPAWLNNVNSSQKRGKDSITPPKGTQDIVRNNWSMYNPNSVTEHSVHFDQSKNTTYEYVHGQDNSKLASMYKFSHQSGKKSERASIGNNILSALHKEEPKEQSNAKQNKLGSPAIEPNSGYKDKSMRQSFSGGSSNLGLTTFGNIPSSSNHPTTLESLSQPMPTFEGGSSSYFYNAASNIASTTFSNQKLLDIPKLPDFKPFDFSALGGSGAKPVEIKPVDSEGLFTSPELLMECRKWNLKSAEKKSNIYQPSSFNVAPIQPINFSNVIGNSASSLHTISALGGLTTNNSTSLISTINSTAIPSTQNVFTTNYPATTLVNNFTFKQQSTGSQHFPSYLQDTQSIVDNSPYKLPLVGHLHEGMSSNISKSVNKTLLDNVVHKDCMSQIKEVLPKPRLEEQPKLNLLGNLNVMESFEKDTESRVHIDQASANLDHSGVVSLETLTPEQVFDIFVFNQSRPRSSSNVPSARLSKSYFMQIARSQFKNPGKLEKIFQYCQKGDSSDSIKALDFGKALEELISKDQIKDPVRDIFGLIDIKQKGMFNLQDYERFLQQVLESEQDNYEEIAELAKRLFKLADVNNNHEIQYWGLYLTKETMEYNNFTDYLSQFQFEIEM